MRGLMRRSGNTVDRDWDVGHTFPELDYTPTFVVGSDDKVLCVDAMQATSVPENDYRQIFADERGLSQFIGTVRSIPQATPKIILRTTGIVDVRTKSKLYVTVKAPDGSPVQLVLPKTASKGRVPKKREFVVYTLYQIGDVLTHELKPSAPPPLSAAQSAEIDARIDKLSF